jgi:hypothetical protein
MDLSYEYLLSQTWSGCPDAWCNFIESFDDKDRLANDGVSTAIINKALKLYNGWYNDDDNHPFIRFDREEDATVFILRWS